MKTLDTLKQILSTTVLTVVTLTSHLAIADKGGSSTGGGYVYEDTTHKHIRIAQAELISAIYAVNQDEIDAITKKYGGDAFRKKKLIEYIKGLRFSELDNGERKEKNRAQDMEYSFNDGGYVTALRPFFDAFHKLTLTPQEKFVLKRKLIHEISHLFQVGNDENQKSFDLSTELVSYLASSQVYCGGVGTVEERLANCERLNLAYSDQSEKKGPVVLKSTKQFNSPKISLYYRSQAIPYEIRDARNLHGVFVAEISEIQLFNDYYVRSNTIIFTPEEVCAKVNTLDGQITWKPATVDNVDQINPVKDGFFYYTVALADGKVRYLDRGTFSKDEGKFTEITNDRRVRSNKFNVVCTGTLN